MADNGPVVRQSTEWLQVAEERLGLGFWSYDIKTKRLTCSGGLYNLIGVSASSVQVDLVFLESLVHPEDRLAISDPLSLATDARQTDRQFRLIRPDGQSRNLHCQANRYFDRNGEASHVVCVMTDISSLEQTRQRLNRKQALLQVVAEILDGVLWIADENGAVLEMFGPRRPGGELEDWQEDLHEDDIGDLKDLWRSAVRRRRPYFSAPRMRRQDGHYERVHLAGLPLARELSPEFNYGGLSTRNSRLLPAFTPQSRDDDLMTPAQVRACRVLLGWTAEVLAERAGISVSTVRRIEGLKTGLGQGDSIHLIAQAFKDAGLTVTFGEGGRFSITKVA